MPTRDELRRTFDEDAERYDRARPRYPVQLLDDLLALAGGPVDVLDVGCGTGQLTVALAERGCRVTGLDLGPAMAAVARRNLASYPDARVDVGAFETWRPPAARFDAVVSATAFHWIDPAVRLQRAAAALRPGGALALVTTEHVAGGTEDFFVEVQRCYERWDEDTPPGLRLAPVEDIPPPAALAPGAPGRERFGQAASRDHLVEIAYTTAEYVDTLLTYSGHRALPPPARRGLLECIARLIETRYGGRVVKRYLHRLDVAAVR
jgi:SAM-dependent methyltransferase